MSPRHTSSTCALEMIQWGLSRRGEMINVSEIKSRTLLNSTVQAGNPCYTYRNRLDERFPISVEVTEALAVEQAGDWDWGWASTHLLTRKGQEAFDTAYRAAEKDYDATIQPYRATMREAWDEADRRYSQERQRMEDMGATYEEAWEAAEAASREVTEVPSAVIGAVEKIAQKRFNVARARAFAKAFVAETDEDLAADRAAYEEETRCNCWMCRQDRALGEE